MKLIHILHPGNDNECCFRGVVFNKIRNMSEKISQFNSKNGLIPKKIEQYV